MMNKNPSLIGGACIIPALLARKTCQVDAGAEGFTAPRGSAMISVVIGFGVLTASFHVLSMMEMLPNFTV
jgi:tryptophan-specific transport protein